MRLLCLALVLAGFVRVNSLWAGDEPPAAGLQLWYAVDSQVETDGQDRVTAWRNRAKGIGEGSALLPAKGDEALAPKLVSKAVQGRPVVRFDGKDDVLRSGDFRLSQPLTIFAVLKCGAGANGVVVGSGDLASEWGVFGGELPQYHLSAGESQFPRAPVGKDYEIVEVVWNSVSSCFRINGTASELGNPGTAGIAGGLSLGARANWNAPLPLDVAEMLIYDKVLEDAMRGQVVEYLQKKYGLAAAAKSK